MNAVNNPNKSLFLSYSRRQTDWCDELYHAIDTFTHYQRWRDNKIPESADWWDSICLNIEGCFAFVALISQDYLDSVYCMGELDYALTLNKPVIALMLEDVEYPSSLNEQRLQFARVQSLDMSRVINKVLNACNQILLSYTEGKFSTDIHPRQSLRPEVPKPKSSTHLPEEDIILAKQVKEIDTHGGQLPTRELMLRYNEKRDRNVQLARRLFESLKQRSDIPSFFNFDREEQKLIQSENKWVEYERQHAELKRARTEYDDLLFYTDSLSNEEGLELVQNFLINYPTFGDPQGLLEKFLPDHLFDYDWLYSRVSDANVRTLIADLEAHLSVFPSSTLTGRLNLMSLIKSALDKSSSVIDSDPNQLSSQLIARLIRHKGTDPLVDDFLIKIRDLPKSELIVTVPSANQFRNSAIKTVSLQGNYALSASGFPTGIGQTRDFNLKVWDWRIGKELHHLQGHKNFVNHVSLQGDYAVSSSDDNTLKVWDWKSGKNLRTLSGHMNPVNHVSLQGDYAVSGSGQRAIFTDDEADYTVRVWNWKTGNLIHTMKGHLSAIIQVAIKQSFVLSAGNGEGKFRVWNWETGELLEVFKWNIDNKLAIASKYNGLALDNESNYNSHLLFHLDKEAIVLQNHVSGNVLARFTTVAHIRAFSVSEERLVIGDSYGGIHFLQIKE